MKRYFCSECGSTLIEGDNTRRSEDFEVYCSMCEDEDYKAVLMRPLPNWETPDQYKARTGREWNGLVWVKSRSQKTNGEGYNKWGDWFYAYFYNPSNKIIDRIILCADKDCAPPEDYKPEE